MEEDRELKAMLREYLYLKLTEKHPDDEVRVIHDKIAVGKEDRVPIEKVNNVIGKQRKNTVYVIRYYDISDIPSSWLWLNDKKMPLSPPPQLFPLISESFFVEIENQSEAEQEYAYLFVIAMRDKTVHKRIVARREPCWV